MTNIIKWIFSELTVVALILILDSRQSERLYYSDQHLKGNSLKFDKCIVLPLFYAVAYYEAHNEETAQSSFSLIHKI